MTREQALQKLRHFCGYQERCHSEIRTKLYSLAVAKKDHDVIIAALIEEGYLDEERFAIAFARGKFRAKQWGKQKIKSALVQKRVSDYSIKKGIGNINDNAYLTVLRQLAEEKYATLIDGECIIRIKKTMDYLLQKGFEAELVKEVLADIK